MVNSNVFSYINVLDKAADAAWLRNEAISNNLANVDTPNYKRQDVSFEDELIRNLNKVEHRTMDAKVYNMRLSRIEPRVYTDAASVSYRLDGNNVDIEFPGMHFTEGVSSITITGRGRTATPIHIRFFSGDTVVKQVVEFPVSEDAQTLTFPIEGFSGDGKVNFIFLPGSDFDLISFQFHA